MRLRLAVLFIIILINPASFTLAGDIYPGETWLKYSNPEEAGFSAEKLSSLIEQYQHNEGAALMVVHEGAVLVAEGEVSRSFRQHSIRKSYLSALVGIEVAKGTVDLDATLVDLGINDLEPLTAAEKQARVIDLLSARSGIYLPSAFSTRGMEENMPHRGSHAPGESWFYNNWDFNVAGTIFNNASSEDLFEAFSSRIAGPLRFQDFDKSKTHYLYERDKSLHPAYLFRMSARDMARFGLLYLRNGEWDGKQVLPAGWVAKSTNPRSRNLFGEDDSHYGYGLMWWTYDDMEGEPMYGAFGAGGQRISVFPESGLVLVHLTDTYINREISDDQINDLCRMLLQARIGVPAADPELEVLEVDSVELKTVALSPERLAAFEGNYRHPFLGVFQIIPGNGNLRMEAGIGRFELLPLAEDLFMSPDIRIPMEFQEGTTEQKGGFTTEMNDRREIEKFILYY